MRINKNPMFSRIKTVVGQISFLIVGVFVVSSIAAYANWAPPSLPPPQCPAGTVGCDPPVNVGSVSQDKSGTLRVGPAGDLVSRGLFNAQSTAVLATTAGTNVGVGTFNPTNKLQVQGKIQANTGDICSTVGASTKCLQSTLDTATGVTGSGVANAFAMWTGAKTLSTGGIQLVPLGGGKFSIWLNFPMTVTGPAGSRSEISQDLQVDGDLFARYRCLPGDTITIVEDVDVKKGDPIPSCNAGYTNAGWWLTPPSGGAQVCVKKRTICNSTP